MNRRLGVLISDRGSNLQAIIFQRSRGPTPARSRLARSRSAWAAGADAGAV